MAAEADEQPDTVLVAPSLESVHRRGTGLGLRPACADRLHNVDDSADWRIKYRSRTDPADHCGHPECFGGDNA